MPRFHIHSGDAGVVGHSFLFIYFLEVMQKNYSNKQMEIKQQEFTGLVNKSKRRKTKQIHIACQLISSKSAKMEAQYKKC